MSHQGSSLGQSLRLRVRQLMINLPKRHKRIKRRLKRVKMSASVDARESSSLSLVTLWRVMAKMSVRTEAGYILNVPLICADTPRNK